MIAQIMDGELALTDEAERAERGLRALLVLMHDACGADMDVDSAAMCGVLELATRLASEACVARDGSRRKLLSCLGEAPAVMRAQPVQSTVAGSAGPVASASVDQHRAVHADLDHTEAGAAADIAALREFQDRTSMHCHNSSAIANGIGVAEASMRAARAIRARLEAEARQS